MSGSWSVQRGRGCKSASRIWGAVDGAASGHSVPNERKGAATALLTTRGFRDVLEIGRLRTPGMFELDWDKPAPLVARRHRLEVKERVGADGSVIASEAASTVRCN